MPGLSVASHPFFVLIALLLVYIAYRTYRYVSKRLEEVKKREQNLRLHSSSMQASKSYGRQTRLKRLANLKKRQADFWTANKYFIVPKVCLHPVFLFLAPLPSHRCRHALRASRVRR